MTNLKHSKYKNTGLLFELLITQITNDTVSGQESKAISILKKHFKPNSPLSQELTMYKALTKEHISSMDNAFKLIEAVISQRKNMDREAIRKSKYNLNKTILESFGQSFYQEKISNYTQTAAVHNLFEYCEKDNPLQYAKNRQTVIEGIVQPKTKPLVESGPQNLPSNELHIVTYKILVEKFNKKYSNLDEGQKNILREYISTVSDGPKLKTFVNSEITNLLSELNNLSGKLADEVMQVKVNEAVNLLEGVKAKPVVKETHVQALLQFHELVRELKIASRRAA